MSDPSAPADPSVLPFTGERFTPECVREIWYEHWHRYAFVRPLCVGRRVLDAACGEGYGSALLAPVATSVTGIDLDVATIEHARTRYRDVANLEFRQGSVTALDLDDASIDVIVSFETIEHLTAQEDMLAEFGRVLAPDGLLVISSPDRDNYNAGEAEPNPFHLRELSRVEFEALLRARFPAVALYGQKLAFHSTLWRLEEGQGPGQALVLDDDGSLATVHEAPVYYVAVCARDGAALPALPGLSVFADRKASVYGHYHSEIRRMIHADHRIVELERELAALRAALDRA